VYCMEYFIVRSEKNFIRHEIVDSPRGNIKDIHGNLLATNRPVMLLYWQGTGRSQLSSEQLDGLQALCTITNVDFLNEEFLLKIRHAERRGKKIALLTDIDFIVLSKIAEMFPKDDNIVIDTHFKRYYPYGSLACHIVGYLSSAHARGQFGLEKLFNDTLSGANGTKLHIVDSVGKKISHIELEKASAGEDIQTTIDITLQEICERIFPEQHTGSLILFNPDDGAIVSLVSRPNFDPNIFLNAISRDTWHLLQQQSPFLNRALDALYPSGSIFKLVTTSAALEHGLIDPDALWDCKGYTFFGKRKYWCARRSGHGKISLVQAVSESCNTLFFEIGKKIDIDLLAEYAHKFGLGQKTDILFPEKVGLIPTRDWKLTVKGEPWWPGETLSVTIGQSFLLVTPIQIARMIASIFTGYLVSPRLLAHEPIIKTSLDIKPDTIAFLKKSMKSVVKYGTGRSVRKIKDIKIYAKTSTAQTSDFEKRRLDPKYLEHGWFVSYFQYKEHQPLVLVIVAERVGAAHVATTIAKNFLISYKKYMDG